MITLERKSYLPRGIYVNKDFNTNTKQKVNILWPLFKEAKKRDRNTTMVEDKIIYQRKPYSTDNIECIGFDTTTIGEKCDENMIAFSSRYSPLSNLYPTRIEIDNNQFKSTEHYYQYMKCVKHGDSKSAAQIMIANEPEKAMLIGKSINESKDWSEKDGEEVMKRATFAKFSQHSRLQSRLENTKNKILVEATMNKKWGTGIALKDKNCLNQNSFAGKNLLGTILMSIRAELRNISPKSD